MGLLPEYEEAPPPTASQEDLGWSNLLYHTVRTTGFAPGKLTPPLRAAKHFTLLRRGTPGPTGSAPVDAEQIDDVLNWYCGKLRFLKKTSQYPKTVYLPEAYTPESFRSKYAKIYAAYLRDQDQEQERQAASKPAPPEVEQAIRSQLKFQSWPGSVDTGMGSGSAAHQNGKKNSLRSFVNKSYAAYLAYYPKVKALHQRAEAERWAYGKDPLKRRVGLLVQALKYGKPEQWLPAYVNLLHDKLHGWDEFGGNLDQYVFQPDGSSKLWKERLAKIAADRMQLPAGVVDEYLKLLNEVADEHE